MWCEVREWRWRSSSALFDLPVKSFIPSVESIAVKLVGPLVGLNSQVLMGAVGAVPARPLMYEPKQSLRSIPLCSLCGHDVFSSFPDTCRATHHLHFQAVWVFVMLLPLWIDAPLHLDCIFKLLDCFLLPLMQQQSVVKNSIDFLPEVSRLFSSGGKIESNTFRLAPALNLALDCKSASGTERFTPFRLSSRVFVWSWAWGVGGPVARAFLPLCWF